jgi:hypothetical protein
MELKNDPLFAPVEIKVRARLGWFWQLIFVAILCPIMLAVCGFIAITAHGQTWRLVVVSLFVLIIFYSASAEVAGAWWSSQNYLSFTAEGFCWGRLPVLSWKEVEKVDWIGGGRGLYYLRLSGPMAVAWLDKVPMIVRILTKTAASSVTSRGDALWIPLCKDWQTVDPKLVIRTASQLKINISGPSTAASAPL